MEDRKQLLHRLTLECFDRPKLWGLSWPDSHPSTARIRAREHGFLRWWDANQADLRDILDKGLPALLDEVLNVPEGHGHEDLVAVGLLQAFMKQSFLLELPECEPARVVVQFLDDPYRRFTQGEPIAPPARRS